MKYDWKIIGHERVFEKIERDIEKGNIATATLFVGPEEIGKYRAAKTFAKILECGEEFSHDHLIARQIEKNIFPDVITVSRLWQKEKMEDFDVIAKSSNFDQSERKKSKMSSDTISIEDVASFTGRLYEKPQARYKICLIKDVHRMTQSAANAFLKILEEPNPRTIFIMTTTHEDLLPETIISRTRVFQMHLVPRETIRAHLEERRPDLSYEEKQELITLTQGRPARLARFLRNPDFLLSERTFFHEIAGLLAGGALGERLNFAENLAKRDREIMEFFDRFLHLLRSLLIEKVNQKNLPLSRKLSYEQLVGLIEKTSLAKKRIFNNVNKRLTLEDLFLSFPN